MVNRSVSGSKLSIWFIAEPCSSFINECSHGSWPFVIWVYASLVHHWNLCKCRQGVLWMISNQLWWQEFGSFANVHQVDHLQSNAAIVSAVLSIEWTRCSTIYSALPVPNCYALFEFLYKRQFCIFLKMSPQGRVLHFYKFDIMK